MGSLYLARQTTDPSVHWCRCKTYLGKTTKLTQTPVTNDFKQVLTKFKQELKTLPTTWWVKFFLQFREGVTKNPKLLWKARLNLEKDSLTWLPMLAESWIRWHWLKVPPPSPEVSCLKQQACRPLPPRSSWSVLETPALSILWHFALTQLEDSLSTNELVPQIST